MSLLKAKVHPMIRKRLKIRKIMRGGERHFTRIGKSLSKITYEKVHTREKYEPWPKK
jgi:hypothetical protein